MKQCINILICVYKWNIVHIYWSQKVVQLYNIASHNMPRDYSIVNIGYRMKLLNVYRAKTQKGLKYNKQ